MLLPRFTIRTALAIVTGCAMLFLIVGMAYRGQMWAWGVTIACASLVLTSLVHAAWFGIVWLFAQVSSMRQGNHARPLGHQAAVLVDAVKRPIDNELRRGAATRGEVSR